MKRAHKHILYGIGSLIVVILLLPSLLYIPAIQRSVTDYAEHWVEEHTDMQLSVGGLSLRFPFVLSLDEVVVTTATGDTLVEAGHLGTQVALLPLLWLHAEVPHVLLEEAQIHFLTEDKSMDLSVSAQHLEAESISVGLSNNHIGIGHIDLQETDIELFYKSIPDTTARDTTTIDWDIDVTDISLSDIRYTMYMPPLIDTLRVSIPSAGISQGNISLSRQDVTVNSVVIAQGAYRYVACNTTLSTPEEAATDTVAARPWSVTVNEISLTDNQATYITHKETPSKGLDVGHIAAEKINIFLSSLYNRGTEVRLQIDDLALQERSGLVVTHASGAFEMADSTMQLTNFALHTPYSDIKGLAKIDVPFLEQHPDGAVELTMTAHLACNDIAILYPDAAQYFVHPSSRYSLPKATYTNSHEFIKAYITAQGTGRKLTVERLNLSQPGIFLVEGTAMGTSLFDDRRRRIEATCKASTTSRLSLENFIPDSAYLNQLILHPIQLSAKANMQGNTIKGDALLDYADSNIAIQGTYNSNKEEYDATVDIREFPLGLFLPNDTAGVVSAYAEVQGERFDFTSPQTRAVAKMAIDSLEYLNYTYRDASLSATLENQTWQMALESNQPDTDIEVEASGIVQRDLLTANIMADIDEIDFYRLHLAPDVMNLKGRLQAEVVASQIDSLIQADVTIDSLSVGMGDYRYSTGKIALLAASDITYSYIDVSTGDLFVNLSSDAGIMHLAPSAERLIELVDTILYKQRLNMDELHRGLPPFTLTASAGRKNIAQQYLNSKGISFTTVNFEATNDSLFNIAGMLQRLTLSGMTLDTINLSAQERDERLNYLLTLGNRAGNLDEFARVKIEGFLSGNSTRLMCTQNNRQGETGFLFGCKADFLDSLIHITFGPKQPIIGYKQWQLNRENFISYNYIRRDIDADIQLQYGNSHLYVTTADRLHPEVEGIHVDIQNIELADWLVASPFTPPISGNISTNLYVDLPPQGIAAQGVLDIENLTYANRRVGTFNSTFDYTLDPAGGNDATLSLLLDKKQVLNFTGYLANDTQKSLTGNIEITQLPLSAANAFFPPNMGELSGQLNSHLDMAGTLKNPQVNGFIRFDNATTTFTKIGASLAFDNSEIPIRGSKIYFDRYAIRGNNKQPLNINGTVDLSDLSEIGINLDLLGENFEPIHIGESRTAIIYGSVFTDVAARVRGTLNNLSVRGRLSLLSGTNATYILQESQFTGGQDYTDMVTFVSFADTIETYEKSRDARSIATTNMNITLDIEIDQGVQLGVNLSPDGKNRIDLVGGGNLLYTMSALGDNRVTGRYNLTGGFVRYTPPIISQKIFNIESSSYVMWNGDIADPMLNIKAVETQRATVSDGNKNSRPVDFDITIYVTNTLADLDISFDLSTKEDLTIQNELQGLSAEQRSSKAINMLLYNSYSDLSSMSASDVVGNPLNAFLEYELNTWAQKTISGVDLSFGIDNYGDENTGTIRTDYTYTVSKSLFDNRLKFVIGGSYATDQDATQNLKENLIDDISLEYRLTKRDNMYLKAFRQTGYESIIEGEITQMGVGFLYRKQVMSLLDLFRKQTTPPTLPSNTTLPTDTTAVSTVETNEKRENNP